MLKKEFERDGNDASLVAYGMTGVVIYFKYDYGFIRPDDTEYDDIFVHVKDIEPWRAGFKKLKGRQEEKIFEQTDGSTVFIPFFPGEKVEFDLKKLKKSPTVKHNYRAINVKLLTEYTGSEIIKGKVNQHAKRFG